MVYANLCGHGSQNNNNVSKQAASAKYQQFLPFLFDKVVAKT